MNNSTNTDKKVRLGKGLAALLGNSMDMESDENVMPQAQKTQMPSMMAIENIIANKDQPRKIFKEQELKELSDSIKENGVIQPIIVRQVESSNKFEIIAGERRFRASKLAGLDRVPVVIKRATNKETLMMAIIENVQRSDLNCVEEALGYYQLMEEFNLTQEEVAKKIGKERSTIANFLRILKLPREVISHVQKDLLSFGHAKVLVALKDDETIKRMANKAIADKLSVRELEAESKKSVKAPRSKNVSANFFDEKIDSYKQKLETKTGYHFGIKSKKSGAGEIVIKYNNEAEFNDIFEYLLK